LRQLFARQRRCPLGAHPRRGAGALGLRQLRRSAAAAALFAPPPPTRPRAACPMIVDAVVVGGGPAGLAAAIALAEAGVEVVVCERGEYPQDKACGEGIQPAGVRALERLGVLPLLGPGAARPITGVCYRAPNGVEARA